MLSNQKTIFVILCLVMFALNGYMYTADETFSIDSFIGGGFGGSLLSIPIWSCIGVVLANIGLFFYKIIKPDKKEVLNIWQKANLGLIAGIILKPLLGILW